MIRTLVVVTACLFGCNQDGASDPARDLGGVPRDGAALDALQVPGDSAVDARSTDVSASDGRAPTPDTTPDPDAARDGAADQSAPDLGRDGDLPDAPPLDAHPDLSVDVSLPVLDAERDGVVDGEPDGVDGELDGPRGDVEPDGPVVDAEPDGPPGDVVLSDANPSPGPCPPAFHLVGEFAEWCGKVNVNRSSGGVWDADPDCVSGCRQAPLPYCRRFWPETTQTFEIELSPEDKPFKTRNCREEFPNRGGKQVACCAPDELDD